MFIRQILLSFPGQSKNWQKVISDPFFFLISFNFTTLVTYMSKPLFAMRGNTFFLFVFLYVTLKFSTIVYKYLNCEGNDLKS